MSGSTSCSRALNALWLIPLAAGGRALCIGSDTSPLENTLSRRFATVICRTPVEARSLLSEAEGRFDLILLWDLDTGPGSETLLNQVRNSAGPDGWLCVTGTKQRSRRLMRRQLDRHSFRDIREYLGGTDWSALIPYTRAALSARERAEARGLRRHLKIALATVVPSTWARRYPGWIILAQQ